MTPDLNRMRRAFLCAAAWCGWTEADQAEIGAEIKSALDAGNEEALAYWAARLEALAGWAHLAALCRTAEAHIKAHLKEQRRAA